MSSKKNNSVSVIVSSPKVLNCSNCFQLLTIPLFKCDNGHIVCSTCCDKLGNKCPKCNISSKRCKAIENILQSMEEISCPNEKHGCRETISYCRNRKHEKECIYELCYCPFSGCDFVASSEVLSSHFIQKHGDSRNKFSYDHSFIVSLNSNDETVVLQEKNDGQLFILKNITMLLGNAVNVCCIGPKSSESRYSYNILACSKMSKLEFHTFVKNVQQVTLKTLSSKFLVIPFGFSEPLEIEICIRSLPCDSMMQIFIKKLDGKVLPLRVKSSDTIYSVKEKIFNKEKYAIIDQRLIFSGNQLPDDQTIANCNIEEKSAIFLVFRLMGD